METISGTVFVPFQISYVSIDDVKYPVYQLNYNNDPLVMYVNGDRTSPPVYVLTGGNEYNLTCQLDPLPAPGEVGGPFFVSVGSFHFISTSKPFNVTTADIVKEIAPDQNLVTATINLTEVAKFQFTMEYSIYVSNTVGQLLAVLDPPMPVQPA